MRCCFLPAVRAELLSLDLLEMIAMAVKAQLCQDKYDRCVGARVDLAKIRRRIDLIRNGGLYHEFRMTVLPVYHSSSDVVAWATDHALAIGYSVEN